MGKKTRKTTGLRLRNGVYYADTSANGTRISGRIGKVSERDAKAILSKMVSDSFVKPHFPKSQENKLSVYEVCALYSVKKLAFLKSAETRKHLFKPLVRLLGNKLAFDLRISDVEEYRRIRLLEKKKINGIEANELVSISTVNHEVKELLMAMQWAVLNRHIEFNPIAGIEHLKEPMPQKIMLDGGIESGDDWTRLYNSIGERNRHSGKLTVRGYKNRLKFLLQYNTGMRIGEINSIEHKWIDQVNLQICLPAEATKSQKPRKIPITLYIVQQIAEYMFQCTNTPYSNDKYLFYNPQTKTHDKSSYRAFNNAVARAGLSDNITSHALRRTRGTIWDSIDERASMEVLGHSDTKIHRKHYTDVTADRVRSLVNDSDNIPQIKSKESASL